MADLTPDAVFDAWVQDVKRRGGIATVWPSGLRMGYKAERFPKTGGGFSYNNPPAPVMKLEEAIRAQEREDIEAGERLQMLQDALTGAARWVLQLPRRVVENVLGLPSWFIPLGVMALAVFLVREWGRRPGGR